jgi:hypothetical protein
MAQPLPDKYIFARLNYTGQVSYSVLYITKLYCDFRIELFPFDTQNCTMHFGSWSLLANQVHTDVTRPVGDLDNYQTHAGLAEFHLFLPTLLEILFKNK